MRRKFHSVCNRSRGARGIMQHWCYCKKQNGHDGKHRCGFPGCWKAWR